MPYQHYRAPPKDVVNAPLCLMNEVERIKSAYGKRKTDPSVYSLFNPGQLFMSQQLERNLITLLSCHEIETLQNKRILEVGCGTAWPLRLFVQLGARPKNLYGVDLLPEAIEEAKSLSPGMNFNCMNAETLPFQTGWFDIVMQFTMFTSILEAKMKVQIAREMLRVTGSRGIIVWYDYFISKPTNPDVKGIGKQATISLFPNCTFDFRKTTLAPPLARILAPYSFLLCYLLEKVPWLRTHYLAVITKKGQR